MRPIAQIYVYQNKLLQAQFFIKIIALTVHTITIKRSWENIYFITALHLNVNSKHWKCPKDKIIEIKTKFWWTHLKKESYWKPNEGE